MAFSAYISSCDDSAELSDSRHHLTCVSQWKRFGSDYYWYVLTICLFVNERMDGALTKWTVGIFTESNVEGPVKKYTTKTIWHS